MFKHNLIRKKLQQNGVVYGTWCLVNDPMLIEAAASSGIDFTIFDFEHGNFSMSNLLECLLSAENRNCAPLARIPKNRSDLIQQALDLGIQGIIVPQIQSFDDIKKVSALFNFPPLGQRGYNPFTRSGNYNQNPIDPKFPVKGYILENSWSFENLDEIISLDKNIDVLYLGVYDLSVDLGLEGNVCHPKVLSLIECAIPKITQQGIHVGLMVPNHQSVDKYLSLGVSFFCYQVDIEIYRNSITAFLNKVPTKISMDKV